MDHHKTLSPSKFPALAQCIHYESSPEDSASRERGTKIHEYMAKFLSGSGGSIPQEEIEYAAKGERLAKDIRELIPDLRGVEHRVSIWNYAEIPPEEVTFGTCDAWGYDEDDMLVLIDAKSGQKRNYTAQMAVYALGLMEDQGLDKCVACTLYCDLEEKDICIFTHDEAAEIVFNIVAKVNAGIEEPQENENCKWCAKKPTCPVWVLPAKQALAIVQDKTFDLESLKQDPIRLGSFLDMWRKARKLVEDAELDACAKAMLTANPKSIPGWAVQQVNGRLSYDGDEIEEIINLIPELGIKHARGFISVNRDAFEVAWRAHSKLPVPVTPTAQAGGYQKLIKSKK